MAKKQGAAAGDAAGMYLGQIGERLTAIREAVPAITRMGERMAKNLLAGCKFSIPPVAKYYPSETGHRAGGMMGIRWWGSFQPGPKDVALFALPDARFWNPEKDE